MLKIGDFREYTLIKRIFMIDLKKNLQTLLLGSFIICRKLLNKD